MVSARHGHQPVVLLGHSMGGVVASVVAALPPALTPSIDSSTTHVTSHANIPKIAAVIAVNSPLWSLPGEVLNVILDDNEIYGVWRWYVLNF